jgi:hypothetical protein
VLADTLNRAEKLNSAFSRTSEIGFAVLDNGLRYQAINNCLAKINCMPANAHLGFSVDEIFGELSEKVAQPSYRRVLVNGETSHFEVVSAMLPTRGESRYWGLNTNFPIHGRTKGINQIGILVVEVTQERKLQKFLADLGAKLRNGNSEETFWFGRRIKHCIDQYHAAIAAGFDVLLHNPVSSLEQLTHSIEALDQRLLVMRKIVAEASILFPFDHCSHDARMRDAREK